MRRDLGLLHISKVIIHDVPRHKVGESGTPVLSEIESPLNSRLIHYFADKIRKSLAGGYNVVFDPDSLSLTPDIVVDQLGAQEDSFVLSSQKLARHLSESQTGVNSAGILTVVEGSVEEKRCLVILKLEREAGLNLELSEHDGLPTFNIQQLDNIMLSTKTKVFKAGLFVQEGEQRETVEGKASDLQRGDVPRTEVAGFFLSSFLGCCLIERPDLSTKRFFLEAMEFINHDVPDPQTKAKYAFALIAAMNDYSASIRPRDFASQHLAVDDRQPFVDYLESNGVSDQRMIKDTALIESRLSRSYWDYDSGLALIGPNEEFERHVRIIEGTDGSIRTEISDRLRAINDR